jgi:hypothetical protein
MQTPLAKNDDGNDSLKPDDKEAEVVSDDKITEKQGGDRYHQTLDAESWDYDAAAEGTDEVTEAYRELLRCNRLSGKKTSGIKPISQFSSST